MIPPAEDRTGAFTATGIAPDLHRTSLLMTHGVNQIAAKVVFLTGNGIAVWYMLNFYADYVKKLREIEAMHAWG